MIQRQQSLWLLLSAVCAVLTFWYPFSTGQYTPSPTEGITELTAGSRMFIWLLTGLVAIVALVTIFLYKDRKTQLWSVFLGILLSGIVLALYFAETNKFVKGTFALWSILSFATFIGFIMAARGIRKDQKLIKSLDKLR